MSDADGKDLETITKDSKNNIADVSVGEPNETSFVEDTRESDNKKDESQNVHEEEISRKENENENEDEDDDGDDIDDLFGDEDEDEDEEKQKPDLSDADEDEEDDGFITGRRRKLDLDDEEEMYTRKFYGEDVSNLSGQEDDNDHHIFKEEDVELVRHMVPYKVTSDKDSDRTIYYAKVPAFLMIDPIAFDPPTFEEKVKERLSNFSSKEDQLGDLLIDENTVRWRYSRDSNQKVFRESNTQIVQWSDGSYSLKIGDEYSDILVNDTDNTFLAVSHDEQELMQCVDGGEVKKTFMFIPTSTNSKVHQRLSSAVARRAQRANTGPGTYLINVDPELEKSELERKQQQIIRERRRRQNKERELLDSPDTTLGSQQNSFNRRNDSTSVSSSYGSKSRKSRRDEYEEDDFLVNDEEDEEFDSNRDDDEDEEEDDDDEEDYDDDDAVEEEEEKARAARLKESKRSAPSMYVESHAEEESKKRRKISVISDDDDE